ncbi:multicomponent Na+:H+ antiporter subunit E [Pontimonas salivibrio]|uniref:Multicomponent Na+:H+ antiporter subunit E n=1 Tax=Pontimonas salivibrio TaxID=1159327 RepID=A0A2L2BP21_9MICO|nr:Na+/H+ antiporter subunit E [Pontimonas salivibrio]AVG23404.1 multicomponent Na+:H+ antiporter subunit E [Pontimonas salivibrio]
MTGSPQTSPQASPQTSLQASPWSLPLRLLGFLGWFIGQFVLTSLQVVALIVTPGKQAEPAIVKLSMDELSDTEVTILLALITITPDTLVIAVNREEGSMFVHGMFVAGDSEGFRASLRATHDRLLFGLRARPSLSLKQGGVA